MPDAGMPHPSHLRESSERPDYRVSNMELFFDLVFVFAVTQLSHYQLSHPTIAGFFQTLVMFLAVWWAWVYTAWATNWLDPERAPVRLMLAVLMLLSLVLSSAIPGAFGPYGLAFAAAYVAIQVGRTAYTAWAREGRSSWNMTRAALYFVVAAVPWFVGALEEDPTRRLLWWAAALAIEYAGPLTFFAVPGLGRSTPADWNISGAHMAERCALFIIISLGEGIVVTGATFARLEPGPANVLALTSALVSSVAMWWIYFDVGARRGAEMIEHQDMPGLVGREAYTYFHIPIVAGIIALAVADEQVLSHPVGHAEPFLVATLVGGALLFIGGAMSFKKLSNSYGRHPLSHIAGLLLFLLLAAWAWLAHPQPLALHLMATGILVLVAVWEWGSYHGGWVERWARIRQKRTKPRA